MKNILILSFIASLSSCKGQTSKVVIKESSGNTVQINQNGDNIGGNKINVKQNGSETTIVVNGDTVQTKDGVYKDKNGNKIIIH